MAKNMLIDGVWRTDTERFTDESGAFQREESAFRDRVRDEPGARFTPAPDRYHLYVSRSCPWAHGAALVRRLTGLEEVVPMDVVDPHREDDGWEFSPDRDGCTPDTVNGTDYLRDVYTAADPEFTGRVTVPVLWDRERETIVNNESIEIMRMLDSAFGAYKTRDVDLYPADYRDEVDRIVEDVYLVNNGVYRAGFADSQAAYDEAVADLFAALDRYDALLTDRRYLAGDRLTLADVRLFPTLVRFDEVYHTHFKCNRRRIAEYDTLWPYLRDLYGTPGFAKTVDMDHIKEGYYREHPTLNPKRIVPVGPDPDFEAPHDRDRLPGGPPSALRS